MIIISKIKSIFKLPAVLATDVLLAAIAVFLLAFPYLTKADLVTSTPNPAAWVVDGEVTSVVRNGNTIYVGGFFSYAGKQTGLGAPVDKTTGKVYSTFPKLSGNEVDVVIPDGSNGWYVGGSFKVDATGQYNLIHVASDGSLISSFDAQFSTTSQAIYALALDGSTLYIGGSFTSAGAQTRNNIAALDAATGAATDWDPAANSTVRAITVDGSTVYAGGDFSQIGGQRRSFLAALDATTGDATSWNPGTDALVRALDKDDSSIYVGGDFTLVNGQTRNRIASLYKSTQPSPSLPTCTASTTPISESFEGTVPPVGWTTAGTVAWTATTSAFTDGAQAATAGDFAANTANHYAKMSNTITMAQGGLLTFDWKITSNGSSNNALIFCLDNASCSATSYTSELLGTQDWQTKTILIPAGTHTVTWYMAYSMLTGWNQGWIDNIQLQDYTQYPCAQSNNYLTDWNPNADSSVYTISVKDTKVYVGGYFANIEKKPRNYIAALYSTSEYLNYPACAQSGDYLVNESFESGTTTLPSWTMTTSYPWKATTTTAFDGSFSAKAAAIGNYGRTALTNTVTLSKPGSVSFAWKVSSEKNDYLLFCIDYASCNSPSNAYMSISGTSSPDWATTTIPLTAGTHTLTWAYSKNGSLVGGQDTGWVDNIKVIEYEQAPCKDAPFVATDWNPYASSWGYIRDIDAQDSAIYVAGDFYRIGGQDYANSATLDPVTASATPFHIPSDNHVTAISSSGNGLYFGGKLASLGGSLINNLAAFNASTGDLIPTFNPDPDDGVTALYTDGTTLYASGWFENMGGAPHYYLAAIDAATGNVRPWDINLNSAGYSMLTDNNKLYVAGEFWEAGNGVYGSESRAGAAAFQLPSADPGPACTAENVVLSESFESGTSTPPGWTTGGAAGWYSDNTMATGTGSSYSVTSGIVYNLNTSWLSTNVTLAKPGAVEFDWYGDMYSSISFMVFCVDNDANCTRTTYNNKASGWEEWDHITVPLTAGNHTLTWKFINTTNYNDGGWLDNVKVVEYQTWPCNWNNSQPILTPWEIDTDAYYSNKIVKYDSNIIIGGYFFYLQGSERAGLGSVDKDTGQLTDWYPGIFGSGTQAYLYDMLVNEDKLYVSGTFDKVGSTLRSSLASFQFASSTTPACTTDTADLAESFEGGTVPAGWSQYGGSALWTATTSAASDGSMSLIAGISGLNPSSDKYIITTTTTLARDGEVSFDWKTTTNGYYRSGLWFCVDDGTCAKYNSTRILGPVESITGTTSWEHIKVNLAAGTHSLTWMFIPYTTGTPRYTGLIDDVKVQEYATTPCGPDPWLMDWNPNSAITNGTYYTLATDGQTLYTGGLFSNVASSSISNLAAFDLASGNLIDAWNPAPNGSPRGTVSSLNYSNGLLYAGGEFTTMGSSNTTYYAQFGDFVAIPGITITQSGGSTAVTNEATDTYTIVLDSQPTSDVTIQISINNANATATPATLTFTDANWDAPQTITVSTSLSGTASSIISHTATSADADYDGISIGNVTVNITPPGITPPPDDDNGDDDGGSGGGGSSFIAKYACITINGDDTETNSSKVTLNFSTDATVSEVRLSNSSDFASSTLTAYHPEIRGWDLCSGPSCQAETYSVYARLYSGNFIGGYTDVSDSINYTPVNTTPSISLIGFTAATSSVIKGNSETAVEIELSFATTSPVTVNLSVGESSTGIKGLDYEINQGAITIPTGSTSISVPVTILDNQIGGGDKALVLTLSEPVGAVLGTNTTTTFTILNNVSAGISTHPDSGHITITEGNDPYTYTVVLDSQPTAPVEIHFSSDGQVTITPETVEFTSQNWSTPQTVAVTVPDNNVIDGTRTSTVSQTISSADPVYDNYGLNDIIVTINDDGKDKQELPKNDELTETDQDKDKGDVNQDTDDEGQDEILVPGDTDNTDQNNPEDNSQSDSEQSGQDNNSSSLGLSGTVIAAVSAAKDSFLSASAFLEETTLRLLDDLLPGGAKAATPVAATATTTAIAVVGYVFYGAPLWQLLTGIKSLSDLWLVILKLFNSFLGLIGLRKKRKVWGTVYDSKTKLPLDPVIVTLVDAKTGKQVEQAITDMAGRYGFLVRPGQFTITAQKTHYAFPSTKETGATDEIYDHLYHGETLSIQSESDVLAPNIPMDSLAEDWNEQEKQRMFKQHPRLDNAIRITLTSLFWLGFIFAFISYLALRTPLHLAFFVFYLVLVIVAILVPAPRLWGRIVNALTREYVPDLLLELSYPAMPNISLAKAKSAPDGKFFLKAEPGDYSIAIKRKDGPETKMLGTGTVKIGKEGIINKDIVI